MKFPANMPNGRSVASARQMIALPLKQDGSVRARFRHSRQGARDLPSDPAALFCWSSPTGLEFGGSSRPMAEIVNLRLARKARTRSTATSRAAVNRGRFGRTLADKNLERSREEKREREFESHRRDPGRQVGGSRGRQ